MSSNFFHFNFFGNNSTNKKNKRQRNRSLRIEELESRDLLSATPFDNDYDNINTLENGLYDSDLIHESIPTVASSAPIVAAAETPTELTGTYNITQANIGNYDFSKVVSIMNATITANGVTLDFSNVTELANTNLYAQGGGTLKFGKLTTADMGNTTITWQATGANSKIEFMALTTLNYTVTGSYTHSIQSQNGGSINLSKLAMANRANFPLYTKWLATGENSVLDISALQTLSGDFTAYNNGEIKFNNSMTSIDGISLQTGYANTTSYTPGKLTNFPFGNITSIKSATLITYGATFDLSKVTSITGSSITANGTTFDFSNVTELANTNLYAQSGGTLKFGKLTAAEMGNVAITWRAT